MPSPGRSGTGRTTILQDPVSENVIFNKIYLDIKYPYETKYQDLINECQKVSNK